MPWKRLPSGWRSKLGDWPNSDDQKRVYHKCSPEQARRIALKYPQINCFFYVRGGTPGLTGKYADGDVVFFSLSDVTRKKLVGDDFSAQASCDLYVKNGMIVAYYDPNSSALPISTLGRFEKANYGATVDVVCIFAANLVRNVDPEMTPLALDSLAAAKRNSFTIAVANKGISALLTEKKHDLVALQEKGISVLLSVMNHHQNTGWSEFRGQDDASQFAKQLACAVRKYGLDGIDIDDEYSHNQDARRTKQETDVSVKNSLAMLAAKLRFEMGDEIISKALFEDDGFFGNLEPSLATYHGKDGNKLFELEDVLTYGWDMAYFARPAEVMEQYIKPGRIKNRKKLLVGFKDGQFNRQMTDVDWLKREGYGGAMVFDCQLQTGQHLMDSVINQLLK